LTLSLFLRAHALLRTIPVPLTRHHGAARPLLGLLTGQHGQALPVVLGAMVIFSVSVGSVMVVSSSSQKATDAHKKGSYANAAAEAGLATAIAVLGSANETTVQQTTLLPSC